MRHSRTLRNTITDMIHNTISGTLDDFKWLMEEGVESETTAALLVLAASLERASVFSPNNAENFGHELALALKHVFEHSTININKYD